MATERDAGLRDQLANSTAGAVVNELIDDARAVGRPIAKNLAFLPLVVIGYLVICVGLALLVAPTLGYAGGFLVIGSANLFLGLVGIWLAPNRLAEIQPRAGIAGHPLQHQG